MLLLLLKQLVHRLTGFKTFIWFNGDVSRSGYTASDERIINEQRTGKDSKRRGRGLTKALMASASSDWGKSWETGRDSTYQGRGLNPGLLENEAGVITTQPGCYARIVLLISHHALYRHVPSGLLTPLHVEKRRKQEAMRQGFPTGMSRVCAKFRNRTVLLSQYL
jgi:hypothetical protein